MADRYSRYTLTQRTPTGSATGQHHDTRKERGTATRTESVLLMKLIGCSILARLTAYYADHAREPSTHEDGLSCHSLPSQQKSCQIGLRAFHAIFRKLHTVASSCCANCGGNRCSHPSPRNSATSPSTKASGSSG